MQSLADATVIAPNSGGVYYTGKYWNDFPFVQKHLNTRATGDPKLEWYEHFFKTQKRPFKKILILNCGNGWVERLLHKKQLLKGDVVGVDFADDLLKEAKEKASKLPFRYYKMDINTAKFPEKDFDLVINHAAAHHIAKLNKVFHTLRQIMTPDGLFLNYDYIGAHRNQYPHDQWFRAHAVNETLPASCRQNLSYPHLPTMLVTDPSEAVHAELILPTMREFFTIDFLRPLGGGLAYLLLTHNEAIQKAPKQEVLKALTAIMDADAAYSNDSADTSLFAYWTARPKPGAELSKKRTTLLQQQEDEREKTAHKNNGHYYNLTPLQRLYLELDDLRIAKQHKQSTIEELQQQNDILRRESEQLRATANLLSAKMERRLRAAVGRAKRTMRSKIQP